MEWRVWCEDFPEREAVRLSGSAACRVGGRFGAWGASRSIYLSSGSEGNVITASRHYGDPGLVAVGEDGASIRRNVIEPQTGGEVRVNRKRNVVLG